MIKRKAEEKKKEVLFCARDLKQCHYLYLYLYSESKWKWEWPKPEGFLIVGLFVLKLNWKNTTMSSETRVGVRGENSSTVHMIYKLFLWQFLNLSYIMCRTGFNLIHDIFNFFLLFCF